MTFRVGQEVVCIDFAGWEKPEPHWVLPEPEHVYTIRSIGPGYISPDQCCLLLVELVTPPFGNLGEPNFRASRFRPVVYDTTRAVEALKASLPQLKTMKVDA